YQSMQEVRGALTALKRQSDSGALYNRAAMAVPPPAQKRSAGPTIAGFLVLAMAVAGGFWWMTHRPASAPPAETKTEVPAPSVPAHDSTLTNDSIVTMLGAKVDPAVIIGQIRSTRTNFDMTAPAVIELSKAGVPASVIAAQIVVKDGLSIHLTLTDDIPATASEGSSLSFKVADDVRQSGALV